MLLIPDSIEIGLSEKWVRFDEESEILIRGLNDDKYQIALSRVRRQITKADTKFENDFVGVLDDEISEHAYQCKLLSRYIIKDWRGVKDSAGVDREYTVEFGERVLSANVDFFLFVIRESKEILEFFQEERSDIVGKL